MSRAPRSRIAVALVVVIAAGCAVAAVAREADRQPTAAQPHRLLSDQRPIRFHNSDEGRAIVHAEAMAPGDSRIGRVRVGIKGAPAQVALKLRDLVSPPGPAGGELASGLRITVAKIGADRDQRLYTGELSDLHRIDLGRWTPGNLHYFRVSVRFPKRERSQNELQGASASFALTWTAARMRR